MVSKEEIQDWYNKNSYRLFDLWLDQLSGDDIPDSWLEEQYEQEHNKS